MFRSSRCDRRAGFTLIEVLVTLGVLAATLASIGALIAAGAKGTRAAEEHLLMTQTVRSIMTGLPDDRSLNIGTMTGQTGGFRWRLDVTPYVGPLVDLQAATRWVPLALTLRVQSPGGRITRVDTIRLQRRTGG